MVKSKNLELKYALTWIITSLVFILISVFPKIITSIASMMHIIEPVNALFLLVIFFLMIIIFTLTVVLSKSIDKLNTLAQELGLIKFTIEKNSKENRGEGN